jgi:hypothetical protein
LQSFSMNWGSGLFVTPPSPPGGHMLL